MISDRPSDWMPELYDIPISLVNKILYQDEQDMIPSDTGDDDDEDMLTHRRKPFLKKHSKIKKN